MSKRTNASKALKIVKAVKTAEPVQPRMPDPAERLQFPADCLLFIGDDPQHPDFGLLTACARHDDLLDACNAALAAGAPDEALEDQHEEACRVVSDTPAHTLAGQLGKLCVKGAEVLDIAERDSTTADQLRADRDLLAELCLDALNIVYRALDHASRGEFWPTVGV